VEICKIQEGKDRAHRTVTNDSSTKSGQTRNEFQAA